MSHFTVTVRIPWEYLQDHQGDFKAAIGELMAPYCEHTGDKGEYKKYFSFVDETENYKKEYETKKCDRVRCPDGKLLSPWDDRFLKPGRSGLSFGGDPSHEVPKGQGYKKVKVPFKEVYKTFGQFCKDWHGSKIDPQKGGYGHWENKNSAWDWWVIGGRWTGFYPLKQGLMPTLGQSGSFDNAPREGRGDIVTLRDIDFAAVYKETASKADNFYEEYTALLEGKEFPVFEGPREWAMTIGLIRVIEGSYDHPTENEIVFPWAKEIRDRSDKRWAWNDVARKLSKDQFLREYGDCFNPILTYAALDKNGWHAPGRMGWWGASHAKSDDKVKFQKAFVGNFLMDHDDYLVCVDAHV